MSARTAISSSVVNESKSIPASVNAWSVGANTVNGPSPCKVDTKLALDSAATKAVCTPVPSATVGMSNRSAGGISTASITWMTPLDDATSAVVTVAPPIITASSVTVNDASSPLTIVTVKPSVTSAAFTAPE